MKRYLIGLFSIQILAAGSLTAYSIGDGDISGDRKSDLFWLQADSQYYSVTEDVLGRNLNREVFRHPGMAEYKIVSNADIDGDLRADLIFQHRTNGDILIWPKGDPTFTRHVAPEKPGYELVAVGNFNSDVDRHGDFLYRVPSLMPSWSPTSVYKIEYDPLGYFRSFQGPTFSAGSKVAFIGHASGDYWNNSTAEVITWNWLSTEYSLYMPRSETSVGVKRPAGFSSQALLVAIGRFNVGPLPNKVALIPTSPSPSYTVAYQVQFMWTEGMTKYAVTKNYQAEVTTVFFDHPGLFEYEVIGAGDFDADSMTDVVFKRRFNASREMFIWKKGDPSFTHRLQAPAVDAQLLSPRMNITP